jgi:hypothetical protein
LIASLRRFRPYLWAEQSKVTSTSRIERENARESDAGERERERASERASPLHARQRKGFHPRASGAQSGSFAMIRSETTNVWTE